MEEKLLAYLERLLGEHIAATDTITVSSTQRARLVSWLNDNGVSADFTRLNSNRIQITDLLNGAAFNGNAGEESSTGVSRQSSPPVAIARPVLGNRSDPTFLGLGIDIQARASMPEAADFRADRFYSANFSPREIGHCIQQGDPLESLAGLWAAKEAIVKAGAGARDKQGGLAAVEIVHDSSGAPTYRGCLLSISHDHGLAVAVCVRLG